MSGRKAKLPNTGSLDCCQLERARREGEGRGVERKGRGRGGRGEGVKTEGTERGEGGERRVGTLSMDLRCEKECVDDDQKDGLRSE